MCIVYSFGGDIPPFRSEECGGCSVSCSELVVLLSDLWYDGMSSASDFVGFGWMNDVVLQSEPGLFVPIQSIVLYTQEIL